MTSANRSPSPIFKNRNKRGAPEMILQEDKIHRIRLISQAHCTVANVVSPSCIWFKLLNHITNQLQYIKPCPIEKIEQAKSGDYNYEEKLSINLYDYVMAPLQEGIYGRGRIINLQLVDGNYYAYVHFIDEGLAHWMNVNCLAVMEQHLFTYPWQAIPISLFKIIPGYDLECIEKIKYWSTHVIKLLVKILSEYEFFRIVPIHNSRRLNNYAEYIRADVFGLESKDDNIGESIAHRLAIEMFSKNVGFFFERKFYDAAEQNLIKTENLEFQHETMKNFPKWRMHFPTDFMDNTSNIINNTSKHFKHKNEYENKRSIAEWDPDCNGFYYPDIAPIRLRHLEIEEYIVEKKLKLCFGWKSIQSPWDFYAFLLTHSKNAMHDMYEEQLKWSKTLDSFYGHPNNKMPIDGRTVMRMLKNEKNPTVYAIHEYNDEATIGSYRRVQVLCVRNPQAADYNNEFCRIRFLDVGGHDIVPLAGLLVIHSSHCKKPPMCLQFSIISILPENNTKIWSEKSCKEFKKLARSDIPFECKIIDQNVYKNFCINYNDLPHLWPDVINIAQVKFDGLDIGVEEEMLKNGFCSCKKNF